MEIDGFYYLRNRNTAVFAFNVQLWKKLVNVRISTRTTRAKSNDALPAVNVVRV